MLICNGNFISKFGVTHQLYHIMKTYVNYKQIKMMTLFFHFHISMVLYRIFMQKKNESKKEIFSSAYELWAAVVTLMSYGNQQKIPYVKNGK